MSTLIEPAQTGLDFPDINRGLALVDGDNINYACRAYNRWPYLDEFRNLIANPDILGIDQLVDFVHFRSVRNLNRLWSVVVPYSAHRDDVVLRLYPITHGDGYPDSVIFEEALRRLDEYDTLILVSSDHDYLTFAEELRSGYNRFRKQRRPEWAREVVTVLSEAIAPHNWRRQASNYEVLRRFLPQPELLLPRPALSMAV